MKIGDKIELIKLYKLDRKSNLKIGDTSMIKSFTIIEDISFPNVIFDKGEIINNSGIEINEEGTYPLYEDQLRIII